MKVDNLPAVSLHSHEDFGGGVVRELRCGDKALTVSVMIDGEATTYVDTVKGERLKGATTALYTVAREFMRDTAIILGRDVSYTFITYSGTMMPWALTKGREIFDWHYENVVNESVDGSELLVCRVRIRAR